MLERLRRFMMGRYGNDHLNLTLVVLGFIIALVFAFVPPSLYFLHFVCYLPLGLFLFRFFSRNTLKRQRENQRFLGWWKNAQRSLEKTRQHWQDRKFYRFFRCPNCKQKLRLPKGRGKIRITCPKCGHVFDKTT